MLATAQASERKWNYDFFFWGGKYKASHLSDAQARTQPQLCHNIQTEAIKPAEKYNTYIGPQQVIISLSMDNKTKPKQIEQQMKQLF